MKFRNQVKFYKVNDDCSVTVQSGDQYYRCKLRVEVLKQFMTFNQGDDVDITFGVAYVRGSGLVLQIIEVHNG